MNTWEITVLYYGKIRIPKGAATPGLDPDVLLDSPYLGFLLRNGQRNILVDTGIDDRFIIDGRAWGGFPAEGGRDFVERALADAELDPLDIDTVIYTHLHNDHAGNSSLFKRARLIFQQKEWRTLLDPLPIMKVRRDYDPGLPAELAQGNCLAVSGDFEPAEGIRCFVTPGHTPGSQSLAVRTIDGLRILVGDHWHLYCMAFANRDTLVNLGGERIAITPAPPVYGRFLPSSIIYDYPAWYESSFRIMAMIPGDDPRYILPGHEAALLHPGESSKETGENP